MKILSVEQVRALDAYTIDHEPIAPIDLMERASMAFVEWFGAVFPKSAKIGVIAGMGNNGGDGLAISRLLIQQGYSVGVWVVRHMKRQKDDFTINFKRLQMQTHVHFIESEKQIPTLSSMDVVIDAMLGSGITRPTEGITRVVAERMNDSGVPIVSVDVASGLFVDHPNKPDDCIVKPHDTVSFQLPKLAFVQPRVHEFVGEWHLVDIGLDKGFIGRTKTPHFYVTSTDAQALIKPRDKFSHKGSYGHALLMAGSFGKIGAAVLAAKACLRSGVGLLTVQVPRCGYEIIQTTIPEAMCLADWDHEKLNELPNLSAYTAIGIGPGLGKADGTFYLIENLLLNIQQPLVLDADALNLLAEHKRLLKMLPEGSILTPHPKEFERLTHAWADDYEKLEILKSFCEEYSVYVVLKGAHTAIGTPERMVYFNSTGNAGMATGGSGDVLTGIITALLAQGYAPKEAAILGVYQHGLAGDRAAEKRGMSAMIASDLIEELNWDIDR